MTQRGDEAEPDRGGADDARWRARPMRAPTRDEDQEAEQRRGEHVGGGVDHVRSQPFMLERSSTTAVERRRKMATTMPEADDDLGGGHDQDEEHVGLARRCR